MEPCTKGKEIGEIKTEVKNIYETIHGNHEIGLKGRIIKLEEVADSIKNALVELKDVNTKTSTVLSGLLKFQIEWEAKEQEREKQKLKIQRIRINNKWIYGILITIILTLLTNKIFF